MVDFPEQFSNIHILFHVKDGQIFCINSNCVLNLLQTSISSINQFCVVDIVTDIEKMRVSFEI